MAEQERRVLAEMPALPNSWQDVARFSAAFLRFFNDNFAFRRQLIAWRSASKVLALGVSSHPDVVLGKEGWLYYDAEQQLADYRGLHPLTDTDLLKTVRALENRVELLDQVKIPYLLVLVPSKHTIYPEYLPDRFARVKAKTRLDQIVEALKVSGRVPFIDLRDSLQGAKSTGLLYFKADTHWNQRGAFQGYREVMKAARQWLPTVPILDINAVRYDIGPLREYDLANFLVLNWYFREKMPLVSVLSHKGARDTEFDPLLQGMIDNSQPPERQPFGYSNPEGEGRVVVFRDSFGSDMVPYLGESFKESLYIWNKMSPNLLLPILRGGFWPDLVIEEVLERLADFD
ncbi:MAG: hypothetical protein KKD63_00195 [Proteobacteria bacterium]|nr:hypothetical protein [Pseudomonadota bacterium]